MPRSRILSSLATTLVGVALLGACSTESLTERAAAFGLEQAIEGDQDIDLDFSDNGSGGFSISTDEGDFSLNFDEDNGGIVFNTSEGDGAISFDEDGIVFDTDQGDGVISFEEDAIVFDTDEGDGRIDFNDSGDVQIQTEEGTLGISSSTEPPPSWPTGLSLPATLVEGSQSFSVLDLGEQVMTTGVFNHDPNEAYGAAVVRNLEAQGWSNIFSSDQDGLFVQLTNNEGSTVQVVSDANGYTTIAIARPR